jgi:hypothetical protein
MFLQIVQLLDRFAQLQILVHPVANKMIDSCQEIMLRIVISKENSVTEPQHVGAYMDKKHDIIT